nr:hypothetical protein [Tanacetum cinerariifolium]
MHNNIMAAGSRDRPPMLVLGRYPQWRLRFLRYVDTRPNGKALRKCILSGPYKPTIVLVHAVEATDNSPAVAEHTTQTSAMTTAMTAILKQFQATPPPASLKAIEEICIIYGGAYPYYHCFTADVVPLSELEKIKKMNEINIKSLQTQINNVKNELINEMKTSIQASMSNQTNELKNMMASFFQMNTASTSSSRPLASNTIANPKEETLTNLELAEYSIKVLPPFVQKAKPPSLRNYVVYQRDPRHPHIHYPLRMNQEKQQEKDEIQIQKFWQIIKQRHINITLADALILILKYQKMLKALLSNKEKLLKLANTPLNENWSTVILKKLLEKLGDPGKFLISIARDVFVPVRKFTFPADLVIVDYESNPRVPLILGRPFLRTAYALIDVYGEEMILRDEVINPLSGNTTSSSGHLLKQFVDELALITFPPGNDDLLFDIESDLREIEYLLNHDPTKEMDSILEDLVDECNLVDPNNDLVDTIPEMFTDEHTLDYSSPTLYDDVDDDLVELELDNDDVYDDPFDSKEDNIKESKLLIGELDPLDQVISFLPPSVTRLSMRIFS